MAELDLDGALHRMIAERASDLHLCAGAPPTIRVDGKLRHLEGYDELEPDDIRDALLAVLSERQREEFERELELDFAYPLGDEGRFRVNVYQQRGDMGAAFRLIPAEIKSLEELGIPEVAAGFAALPRGLVLVTGPTGSGKSTTLAAIVDLANETRTDHIVTVEDPIEYLHHHKRCLVNQREVGEDTLSFAAALKHALREDPDIILVGEMRDLETISAAITAAETGHLVFATLHTQDAPGSIERIIDVFPPHQQGEIRAELADIIQAIMCQTLCPKASGSGRVAATEVMIATPAIRNLVRDGRGHQIASALQSGGQYGMHTMDQDLADLVHRGLITQGVAREKCHDPEDLDRLLASVGGAPQAAQTTRPRPAGPAYGQQPAPAPTFRPTPPARTAAPYAPQPFQPAAPAAAPAPADDNPFGSPDPYRWTGGRHA